MPLPQRLHIRLVVLAVAIVGAYVALRAYPRDLPAPPSHADFLAVVFQSRALVFTGRITLLCVAAFVVLSIVARIWNREWLTKAGPFEISQSAAEGEVERDALKEQLARAEATIEALEAGSERFNAPEEANDAIE